MRTTLNLDKRLLEMAMKLSQKKTKTATVNEALESYVRAKHIEGLIALAGKIHIDDNLEELEQLELEEGNIARRRRR